MNSRIKHKVDFSFLLLWVVAGILGTSIGGSLGIIAGERLGNAIYQTIKLPDIIYETISVGLAGLFNGAVSSVFISLVQWVVLSRYISRAWWWLPASFFVSALAPAFLSLLGSAVSVSTEGNLNSWLILICGGVLLQPIEGLATGFLEWLVLKGATPRAGWWIGLLPILNFFSIFIKVPASLVCFTFNSALSRYLCNIFTYGISGGIIAIFTGLALIWLFAGLEPPHNTMADSQTSSPL